MNTEQKVQAYDKALEIARQYYEKDSMNAFLDTIFPELAESEDERIRKRLIEYFEGFRMGNAEVKWEGLNVQEVLVWLEKQKECVSNNFDDVWDEEDCEEIIAEGQKLTPRFKELLKEVCHAWYDRGAKLEKLEDASKAIEAVDRIDKYIDEHLANAHDMKDSNPDKKYYRGWDDALGKMAGILQDVYSDEKQKEQKPAEWSEKYIADVFEKVGLAKIVREQGNDGLTNALQAAMIELSKVRTTEWNEEDKEMLGKVLECIRFAEDRYQLEEEGTNGTSVKLWLIDHIIPQPKQEWSEEDKKMCNNILNVLTPYLVYDGTYTRTTFGKKYKYGSEIRWIKSLPERFNLQPKQEWSEEDEKDMAHIIRILDDCYVYGTHDLSKTDRENLVNKLKSLRPSWKPSEEQTDALERTIHLSNFGLEEDRRKALVSLYEQLKKLM